MDKNGTMICACAEAPECNSYTVCPYGGTPKADGTQSCICNSEPNCSSVCIYGGDPKGDGSQACECKTAPDCTGQYGGYPLANGTQECRYNPEPDCSGQYGGHPVANGTQDCYYNSAPDCAAICEYGGAPKGEGTQECICNTYTPIRGVHINEAFRGRATLTINGGVGPYVCTSTSSRSEGIRTYKSTSNVLEVGYTYLGGYCRGEKAYTYFDCTDSKGSSGSTSISSRGNRSCH